MISILSNSLDDILTLSYHCVKIYFIGVFSCTVHSLFEHTRYFWIFLNLVNVGMFKMIHILLIIVQIGGPMPLSFCFISAHSLNCF